MCAAALCVLMWPLLQGSDSSTSSLREAESCLIYHPQVCVQDCTIPRNKGGWGTHSYRLKKEHFKPTYGYVPTDM